MQLREGVRKKLIAAITRPFLHLRDSAGVLQMHHNKVSRVVFGGEMLNRLNAIDPVADTNVVIDVYQAFFLSHNVIQEGANLFLANHLSFISNRFRFAHDPLGSALSESAAYVGNSALNDFRLSDISRTFDKAANIAINIVHNV